MHFTSLTRRARAEQDLLTTQQVMVDRFVTDTVGTVHDNREISRTLFEMLLPNRLKDCAEMRGNLVLVLDQRSARFPWEMLEDRWSDQHRPPSVEYGMIRQLSTQTYRTQLSMVSERRALVVGDPVSKLVPLPGAREEAEAVQARLLDRDYQVKSCIGSESHAIVTALFGDVYQILHLAGHGIHRQRLAQDSDRPQCNACGQQLPVNDEELVSGMVIGQDVVLTANDVEQMRQVPELVFINCCHLARTDSAKLGDSDDNTPVHRLAANLAEAFIRMGVRAVVAAGWAVDDRAANTFATTFYRKMMEGRGFGTAVRLAREQTWNESPNINTWGAYQCYGDPDFTLSGKHDQNGDQSDDSSYVSPLEAQADLGNLRAEAGSATLAQTATLAERLAAIETRIDQANHHSGQDWRQHGDLAESLGRTHGELGHFEQAVAYLNSAIAADDAGASCAAVEQRARYHGRWALQLHLHGDIERATKEFDAAWQALNRVQLNPGDQLTVERYRSLTGIYSRRVQTRPPTDRKEDLEGLITTYDQADQQLRQRPGAADHDPLDLFSQVLWLTAKLMLTAYSQKTMEELCPDFEQRCERLKQRAHDEAPIDSGFQTAATSAEIRLLEELHHGRLNDEIANEVIADLRSAINHGFSQRQQSSLMNNLNLLHTLSAGATVNKRHFHRQAGALARIRDALGV